VYRGQAVAEFIATLRYKSEGRGFDSRRCHLNLTERIPLAALWTWGRLRLYYKWVLGYFVGGKCGRCVRLTLLLSCVDCLQIRKSQYPVILRSCTRIALHFTPCIVQISTRPTAGLTSLWYSTNKGQRNRIRKMWDINHNRVTLPHARHTIRSDQPSVHKTTQEWSTESSVDITA